MSTDTMVSDTRTQSSSTDILQKNLGLSDVYWLHVSDILTQCSYTDL